MELLVVCLGMSLFSLINASSVLPLNILAVEPNPCDTIRNGQFVCKDCQTMAFCVQKETGWETINIGSCSGSLFCDELARGCTYQSECPLNIQVPRFACQQPGNYPDPFDCQKYHICNNQNQDEPKICPNGLAYSPSADRCSLSTDSIECETTQYNCPQLGYMAAWPTNANIYYVCLPTQANNGSFIRYPALYRCPTGQIFKKDKCVARTTTTAAIETPITPIQTVPTTSSRCATTHDLVVNPNDCYSYFQCIQGKLVLRNCPRGTYFDSSLDSCRFGTC